MEEKQALENMQRGSPNSHELPIYTETSELNQREVSDPPAYPESVRHISQQQPHQPALYAPLKVQGKEEEEEDLNPGLAMFMNVIFFWIGGGLFHFTLYLLFSLTFGATIVGFPMAVDLFKAGIATAFPYGRRFQQQDKCSCSRVFGQIFWFPFGLIMYLYHLAMRYDS